MRTHYHGSRKNITAIDWAICLTDDEDIAESYLSGDEGRIYTIEMADARIADEDDLTEAAESLNLVRTADCVAGDWTDFFEAADRDDVRAALSEQGYAGVEYGDTTYTGRSHTTILVWDGSVLTIAGSEMMAA